MGLVSCQRKLRLSVRQSPLRVGAHPHGILAKAMFARIQVVPVSHLESAATATGEAPIKRSPRRNLSPKNPYPTH
jgi:hypothetical protein